MINPKTNRYKNFYLCLNCRELFGLDEMNLEHIVAIELQDYSGLEAYYILMFDVSNVEPWCKTCSLAKNIIDKKLIKERNK